MPEWASLCSEASQTEESLGFWPSCSISKSKGIGRKWGARCCHNSPPQLDVAITVLPGLTWPQCCRIVLLRHHAID